jgi:hypothetical protein
MPAAGSHKECNAADGPFSARGYNKTAACSASAERALPASCT